ncbi:hypothetical protein BDF22DRAFT_743875 [Syncephalis plumigaleata]|nr:hypothetical protein BDF22DRAFT_743875 [Syncephalis plumigaleata]
MTQLSLQSRLTLGRLYGILLLLVVIIGKQLCSGVHAFYIAANAPRHYRIGEPLPVYWNKIYPGNNLLGPSLNYARLPFVCPPESGEILKANIGQRLSGDELIRSSIQLRMDKNETCLVLCRRAIDRDTAEQIIHLIRRGYMVEWFADELPGTHPWSNIMGSQKRYGDGFPLGYYDPLEDKVFIYNHFIFQILYEKLDYDPDQRLIVGFEIYPKSVESAGHTCRHDASIPGMPQQEMQPSTQGITYTYSVLWIELLQENQIKWGQRWRNYLRYENDKSIPIFSLINATVILLVLALVIGVIVLRILEIDFPFIGCSDSGEQDELNGWKQLHGDVFRPPESADTLAILIGSGLQLLGSVLGVLLLGVLGIVNPSYPGGAITWAIILYTLGGAISGFTSARLNKTLVGTPWKRHAIWTAILVPGSLFILVVLLNFFVWAEHASILALLLCIASPITLAGAYIGNRFRPFQHPVRVNAYIIAGIPSFGAIFLEEYLSSIICGAINSTTFTATPYILCIIAYYQYIVSVSMTYFQLCNEDHRWWWHSFLFGGSVSIYIFGYAIIYYILRLQTEGLYRHSSI